MFINLEGGLGNQLFQYVFGQYLIAKNKHLGDIKYYSNNTTVRIDSLSISDFKFPIKSEFADSEIVKKRKSRVDLSRFVSRHSKVFKNFYYYKYNIYYSGVVGFDSNLIELHPNSRIFGYFQTHKYVDDLKTNIIAEFDLKKETELFREIKFKVLADQPLIIHVRRGDYTKSRRKIGLLDADYYLTAINIVKNIYPQINIWVFSDDKFECERLLSKLPIEIPTKIYPDSGLSTSETMKVMSLGKAIIIANSTFSWWAAYLSPDKKIVISPDKWFRRKQDPLDLIPKDWIRVPSTWE
jgi:hypothetical protein